jgi:hypothetical protein
MASRGNLHDVATRHLLDAIEGVRRDLAKVELWAGAVNGLSQPVPDYDPKQCKIWLPPEQAARLK